MEVHRRIPLLDLGGQYEVLRGELHRKVLEVLDSGRYILGEEVERLESSVAGLCGVRYGVGVSSGTDALLLALMALGVGVGDEVITTPFSFFATVGVVVRLGARPVFVDISLDDYNLDVELLADAITSRTRAILPVHLYGQCAAMEEILEVAGEIPVVEDAAQAIGAGLFGRRAGGMGRVGCFSFYPSKNLGGVGEGGMCTTGDEGLYRRLRSLRNHGMSSGYVHTEVGGNFRLGAINAGVLNVKFPHLEDWNRARRRVAGWYEELFLQTSLVEEGKVVLPRVLPGREHVFHQYVIRTPRRDELREFLAGEGIGTNVYYPLPLSLQPCLRYLGYRCGDFPLAERAAAEVLALPMYPELTFQDVERVVGEVDRFWRRVG